MGCLEKMIAERKTKKMSKRVKRKKGCCGTCKWHDYEDITYEWVCVNAISEHFSDYTDYDCHCDKYERTELIARKSEYITKHHLDFLLWLIGGVAILINGEISRFAYGLTWISLLTMLWYYCPTCSIKRLEGKENE